MTKRACSGDGRIVSFFLAIVWLVAVVGAASAWEVPDNWSDIGTVHQWQAMDTKFYRSQDSALFLDESNFNLNQVKVYEKTFRYRGQLAGIGLTAWLELDADTQNQRRTAARRELKYLMDFRNRILSQAQDVRQTGTSGWGAKVGDRTVVGDALSRLYTAVNLDPSNPYAWHLYSYFASLVGDDTRSLRALGGAQWALAEIPTAELKELRAAVALDKAWLLRDQGEFDAAHASLETVAANGGRGPEARLLQGLLAAQMGDDHLAITIANELRGTKISIYPPNLRSNGFAPDVADVSAWGQVRSSYLSDWIQAYTWLREGRVDMARAVFGQQQLDAQRPFAARFWREAGAIYEVTGRRRLAQQAWLQARVVLPYYPYMVYKTHSASLARLTGRGGLLPYLLGFDSKYLSGSRLAYGADLVTALAVANEPLEREKLAGRALDQLEICEKFGVYPGQAVVLQGQVYYLMNDLASAQMAVEEALAALDARGDAAGLNAVLSGLNQARADLQRQDIANFYGQSGTSQGRWQGDTDPAGTLKTLRADFAADPSDENRRSLARALIRVGKVTAGRDLASAPLATAVLGVDNIGTLVAEDMQLILEADRATGDTAAALLLVNVLQSGQVDTWQAANVWALAGFICLDNGLSDEGRVALERAAALDPGNRGLQVQLSLM